MKIADTDSLPEHIVMTLKGRFAFFSYFLVLLPGCTGVPASRSSWTATIIKIEEEPGQHFSLYAGAQPLYCIYLRPTSSSSEQKNSLRILVLGRYLTETYGGIGDLVELSYPGPPPIDQKLWFEQLAAYTVLKKSDVLR